VSPLRRRVDQLDAERGVRVLPMTDRSDLREITWRQGDLWHRMRFEPQSDGSLERIEEVRHSVGGTWRPRGSDRVDEVRVDSPPVGTSNAGP